MFNGVTMAKSKTEIVTEAARRWGRHQDKVRQQLEDKLPPSGWYDGALYDHAVLADAYLESEETIKELVAALDTAVDRQGFTQAEWLAARKLIAKVKSKSG